MNNQAFHSRIIGKIRDEGIILAGPTADFRLALTPTDIQEYLSHDNAIIGPMLARILKSRSTVKTDTASHQDILEDPRNRALQDLADAFQDSQVTDVGEPAANP